MKPLKLMKPLKQNNLLSDLVFYRTYADTLPDGTKETWEQCVKRLVDMHTNKFGPEVANLVDWQLIANKEVLPSMRSLQFAGNAVERENLRLFNCAYTTLITWKDFADVLYLLTCGCGVGFSVEQQYITQLPDVNLADACDCIFGIPDSREGWADSVQKLMGNPLVRFDYSAVRPKGASLSTGGTASGPEPLRQAHEKIRAILLNCGGRLSSLNVLDIITLIADAIVVGGVRRSACIAFCDFEDKVVQACKEPSNLGDNYHRYRVNITVIVTEEQKRATLLDASSGIGIHSPSGEPAFYVRPEGTDYGLNPCGEINLRPRQLCNLTTVNLTNLTTLTQVSKAVQVATRLGTMQATYSNFGYVSPEWQKNTEEDALLGVSFTGIGMCPIIDKVIANLPKLAKLAKATNEQMAKLLGINTSKRIGAIKPEGTTSALCQTSSGIHFPFAEYFIRRVRIRRDAPEAIYLQSVGVQLEQDNYAADTLIVSIPCKGKKPGSAIELVDRALDFQENWCKLSANDGIGNNVSLTAYWSEETKSALIEQLLPEGLRCASFFPENNTAYDQAPFEACDKLTYEHMVNTLAKAHIDFSEIGGIDKNDDNRLDVAACAGGACEIH